MFGSNSEARTAVIEVPL